MYKRMGLSSEQVCEIGKWKNVTAFTSHYLRLGASHFASDKISQLVHRVSPLGVAESDLTWTPGKHDTGGSVREDEARSNGETRFVCRLSCAFMVSFFLSSGGRGGHCFVTAIGGPGPSGYPPLFF